MLGVVIAKNNRLSSGGGASVIRDLTSTHEGTHSQLFSTSLFSTTMQ
jgi:hypothetical protein